MTTEALDQFMAVYHDCLLDAVRNHPDKYTYPVAEVPAVVARMRAAFHKGTYSHDGLAIRAAAKRLGIKPTRKALEAFLQIEREKE